MRLTVQRRLDIDKKLLFFVPVVSIFLSFIVGGMILSIQGINPFSLYKEMIAGAFFDIYGIQESIVKAIPLILCGVGVSISFKMLLWNIGAEGQLYMGAFATAFAVRYFFVNNHFLMILIMLIFSAFFGGLWAVIPGFLKAKWNVNEIITTLMMNYIAILWVDYLVYGPWKDPASLGFPMTPEFPEVAKLKMLIGDRIHFGLVFALAAMVFMYFLLEKTKFGYEIRVTGGSRKAAEYAGMNYIKNVLIVMFISGMFSGISGFGEVAGLLGRLQHGFSPGYGYTAIIVAWLARLNPWMIGIVSFLIGGLFVGGDIVQITMRLPLASVHIIQGLILFFVLGGDFFVKYKISIVKERDV